SIVEKEAGGPGEWQRIASVFVNRLNRGMRLEADATVAYGLTEGRERRGFDLTRSELQATTPWNTYQVDGLPPTPIGNPGRAAIEASVREWIEALAVHPSIAKGESRG
ncbi:MAG: endolytic transglycosylase MltG, partial [Acidobacteriota bacterium]